MTKFKITVTKTYEFDGCYDGCPYEHDTGCLSPTYCTKANRRISGLSSKSCEIPTREHHPKWCPLVEDV